MRTDAKIGFAIGGVLLAVLAAYLLVIGPKHNNKKTVALVPPADVTPAPVEPVVVPAAPAGNPPVVSTGDAGASVSAPPAVTAPPINDHTKPALPDTRVTVGDDTTAKLFHPTEPPTPVDSGNSLTEGVALQSGSTAVDPSAIKAEEPKSEAHAKSGPHHASAHRDHTITAERTVASGPRQYTIRSGQTLSSIAADVYGNARYWVAIQRENVGLDAKHLKVGQKINMPDISDIRPGPVLVDVVEPVSTTGGTEVEPTAHTYRVQSGDSLYKISKKLFGTSRRASAIYALNKELIGDDDARLKLGMLLKLPEFPNRTAVTSIGQ